MLKFFRVGLRCVCVMDESDPLRDIYQALPLPLRSSTISVALVGGLRDRKQRFFMHQMIKYETIQK